MRRGFPGLALLVQETLKADPHSGHLFVFRGRRGDLVKIIRHDGQGACLFSKRLERGRFIWPTAADGAVMISPAQLGYMLDGIDWRAPQRTYRPEIAAASIPSGILQPMPASCRPTPSPATTASTSRVASRDRSLRSRAGRTGGASSSSSPNCRGRRSPSRP